MDAAAFDALFDQFRHSAFRLEARPFYSVGGAEAERIAAWREHRPRPERSVRTNPWLARVARTTGEGKVWQRLRILDNPLTEYQRYQLTSGSYLESLTAGDDTVLIDRAACGELGDLPDFWLFDALSVRARMVVLEYTEAGAFAGFREVTDGDEFARLSAVGPLLGRAVPLATYLASMESIGA